MRVVRRTVAGKIGEINVRRGIHIAGGVGLAALFTVVAALASGAVTGSPGTPTRIASFQSRALDETLHFAVSLPPGYDDGRRYPVVYFLHGLPAGPSAYQDASLAQHALDDLQRQAILVAPQGASDRDSDPEYLDHGRGQNWETAIARELPAYVDRHYRTIANRRGRAIIGLSAGGYGAMLIGLHNLDRFSVIESWSGYHRPTDPSGLHVLDLGSSAANAHASAHSYVGVLRKVLRTKPTFIGFYVGTGDSRFRADNVRLHQELVAAHVPHRFRLYPGGHERALWSAHATEWLEVALARLSPAAFS
jgi:enterochelin esterase-like enzyme